MNTFLNIYKHLPSTESKYQELSSSHIELDKNVLSQLYCLFLSVKINGSDSFKNVKVIIT